MSRRGRLEELRRELEAWCALPPSARAFHRMRRTLGEDLDIEAGRLLPWGGGDALVELEERAGRLRPVAEGLRALFEQRDLVEAQHAGLAARLESGRVASPVGASELSRWRVELVRIGEGVRSTIDLEIEHRQLEELASSIEAAMALTPPPERPPETPSPPAAPVARPAASEPSPSPESPPEPPPGPELSQAVEAAPPAPPPAAPSPAATTTREPGRTDRAAVHRLEELGRRLWEWATVVPAHGDAIAELSHRKEEAVAGLEDGLRSSGDSIQSLLEASEALLGTITGSARDERSRRRRRLEERLRALARLVEHPDLEERAATLFADPVENARRHRSWLADLTELEGVLRDRLHNDHRLVDGAFDTAVGRLRLELDGLGQQPLGEAVAVEVERLADELDEWAATAGVEARFDALGGLHELERELKTCREKAAAELTRHVDRRESLRRRAATLQSLADSVEGFTPAPTAGDLRDPANPQERLEDAERALDKIDALVSAEEERFIDACAAERARLAEHNRALASVLDIAVLLRLLDTAVSGADVLEADRSAERGDGAFVDPADAATALDTARRRRARLEDAFEQVVAATARRLPEALDELESLDSRRLRPGERQERVELVAEAAPWAPTEEKQEEGEEGGEAPPVEACTSESGRARLEARLLWLRRQSDLVDRVEGDRRRAVARHRRLVSRLESLERRRLSEVCPKVLVERLHALVHGLEEHGLDEAVATYQLGAAEELLMRLETHARRLLAEGLESARNQLAGDPSPAARAALAELDAAPADELPPPALRRRLFHLVHDEDMP